MSLIAKCLLHPRKAVYRPALEAIPFFFPDDNEKVCNIFDEALIRSMIHLLDNGTTQHVSNIKIKKLIFY